MLFFSVSMNDSLEAWILELRTSSFKLELFTFGFELFSPSESLSLILEAWSLEFELEADLRAPARHATRAQQFSQQPVGESSPLDFLMTVAIIFAMSVSRHCYVLLWLRL